MQELVDSVVSGIHWASWSVFPWDKGGLLCVLNIFLLPSCLPRNHACASLFPMMLLFCNSAFSFISLKILVQHIILRNLSPRWSPTWPPEPHLSLLPDFPLTFLHIFQHNDSPSWEDPASCPVPSPGDLLDHTSPWFAIASQWARMAASFSSLLITFLSVTAHQGLFWSYLTNI